MSPGTGPVPSPAPAHRQNGNVSAYGSTKKSNGLITVMSATRSTTISIRSTRSGNTTRATQLPYGSCCQFRKCLAGSTLQRIAEDRRAAVRRRPQAHLVRRRVDEPVKFVAGAVLQRYADGHATATRIMTIPGSVIRRRRGASLRPIECESSGNTDRIPRSVFLRQIVRLSVCIRPYRSAIRPKYSNASSSRTTRACISRLPARCSFA